MKLTQQIKKAFIEGVLSNEVTTPNFAAEIEERWVKLTVLLMPVSVAAVYRNEATRQWISADKVMATRRTLANMQESCRPSYEECVKLFAEIDGIEVRRARHQVTIDNIRDAITQASNSVTTVEGLKKLLPQYSKYLPVGTKRPSREKAEAGLEGLDANIKTANILSATANAPTRVKRVRAPAVSSVRRGRK